MTTEVAYAVEGPADEAVAESLIRSVGLTPRRIFTAGGKSRLDAKLPGYNRSGFHRAWLVLRDLDHDDDLHCVAEVAAGLLREPVAPKMAFRLVVRSVESWLLADRQGFSEHFRVRLTAVPPAPDSLDNPKRSLIAACRSSQSRSVRAAVVPRPGSGRMVGADYTTSMRDFTLEGWSPERARSESPSLDRALRRLDRLVSEGAW